MSRETKLTNPRSKSRSDLGFSLESDFPTTQPHPHAPEKVSNKQEKAIQPKRKLPVHLNRVLKCLEPIPKPKHSPWRSKKYRAQEYRSIENGFYIKIEIEVKWSPKMKDVVLDVPLV